MFELDFRSCVKWGSVHFFPNPDSGLKNKLLHPDPQYVPTDAIHHKSGKIAINIRMGNLATPL